MQFTTETIELEPVVTPNPFTDVVRQAIKDTEGHGTEGAKDYVAPNSKHHFVIVIDDEYATNARTKVGKAANAEGRTAALVIDEPGKKTGTTRLVFKIKPRMRAGTRARRGGTVATADTVEAPTAE